MTTAAPTPLDIDAIAARAEAATPPPVRPRDPLGPALQCPICGDHHYICASPERRAAQQAFRDMMDPLTTLALVAEVRRLQGELEATRECLKPFADDADIWCDSVPDDYHPKCCEPGNTYAHPGSEAKFSVGDLRRAVVLLARQGNGEIERG